MDLLQRNRGAFVRVPTAGGPGASIRRASCVPCVRVVCRLRVFRCVRVRVVNLLMEYKIVERWMWCLISSCWLRDLRAGLRW